jgi:hypothetical protein
MKAIRFFLQQKSILHVTFEQSQKLKNGALASEVLLF